MVGVLELPSMTVMFFFIVDVYKDLVSDIHFLALVFVLRCWDLLLPSILKALSVLDNLRFFFISSKLPEVCWWDGLLLDEVLLRLWDLVWRRGIKIASWSPRQSNSERRRRYCRAASGHVATFQKLSEWSHQAKSGLSVSMVLGSR